MRRHAVSIDDYLASIGDDKKRRALEKPRKTIQSATPQAEECLSDRLRAYRQGKVLVALGVTNKHCAFYPMSSTIVARFADELVDYDTSKGTIRFQPDTPLPTQLVQNIVRARLAENAAIAE
jgi:uncharacterized protein YdhG (YjbR/CyaY superfamily)